MSDSQNASNESVRGTGSILRVFWQNTAMLFGFYWLSILCPPILPTGCRRETLDADCRLWGWKPCIHRSAPIGRHSRQVRTDQKERQRECGTRGSTLLTVDGGETACLLLGNQGCRSERRAIELRQR